MVVIATTVDALTGADTATGIKLYRPSVTADLPSSAHLKRLSIASGRPVPWRLPHQQCCPGTRFDSLRQIPPTRQV